MRLICSGGSPQGLPELQTDSLPLSHREREQSSVAVIELKGNQLLWGWAQDSPDRFGSPDQQSWQSWRSWECRELASETNERGTAMPQGGDREEEKHGAHRHKNIHQQLHKEKAMAPHSSTLAWKIPWTEEPGGLQSMGSQRVGHD